MHTITVSEVGLGWVGGQDYASNYFNQLTPENPKRNKVILIRVVLQRNRVFGDDQRGFTNKFKKKKEILAEHNDRDYTSLTNRIR